MGVDFIKVRDHCSLVGSTSESQTLVTLSVSTADMFCSYLRYKCRILIHKHMKDKMNHCLVMRVINVSDLSCEDLTSEETQKNVV